MATLTGHTHGVLSLALSVDGSVLYSGSRDNTIRVWNTAKRESMATLTGHTWDVLSLALS
jgi:WD40 repeat protein